MKYLLKKRWFFVVMAMIMSDLVNLTMLFLIILSKIVKQEVNGVKFFYIFLVAFCLQVIEILCKFASDSKFTCLTNQNLHTALKRK